MLIETKPRIPSATVALWRRLAWSAFRGAVRTIPGSRRLPTFARALSTLAPPIGPPLYRSRLLLLSGLFPNLCRGFSDSHCAQPVALEHFLGSKVCVGVHLSTAGCSKLFSGPRDRVGVYLTATARGSDRRPSRLPTCASLALRLHFALIGGQGAGSGRRRRGRGADLGVSPLPSSTSTKAAGPIVQRGGGAEFARARPPQNAGGHTRVF
jgi:hypothetical protein